MVTYFKTYDDAVEIRDNLPPFNPSRFLTVREIENGACKVKIVEFIRGFAIQLGDFGEYYPATDND